MVLPDQKEERERERESENMVRLCECYYAFDLKKLAIKRRINKENDLYKELISGLIKKVSVYCIQLGRKIQNKKEEDKLIKELVSIAYNQVSK